MRNLRVTILSVAVFVAALNVGAQQGTLESTNLSLEPTNRTVSYAAIELPDWSHGWAIGVEGDPRVASRFVAISREGSMRDTRVTLPAAETVMLKHVVAATDGTFFATGHAFMKDGRGQYYIARVGADGTLTDAIYTGPFTPMCLCASPDGSVWALGSELNAAELGEPYALVRHFRFGAGETGRAVASTDFSDDKNPFRVISTRSIGGTDSAWLRCDSQRAYLYSNLTDELVEIDGRTHAVSRWRIESPSGMKVVSLAVTQSGRLFANLLPPDATIGDSSLHLFALKLSSEGRTAQWDRIDRAAERERTAGATGLRLWGADGAHLLLESGEGYTNGAAVRWTAIRDAANDTPGR